MRTNDNLLITILGKPMRFLRNFLRKLKITTFFNTDITGPGFVITSSSSHDGPHFLSRFVFHRKEGKNMVFPKKEEMKKLSKSGFPYFLSQKDIHRNIQFCKEEKNTGYPKMRKWRKYPKTGFLTFYPRRIFPDIHFTVFNFLTFPFRLALTEARWLYFHTFFSVSTLIPTSFYIEIFPNLYWPNLTLPQLKLSNFQEIITLNRLT